MKEVSVALGSRSYPIYVGPGILREIGSFARRHLSGERILIVTNPTVAPLFAAVVEESLAAAGFGVRRAEIPDGEEYKTLATVATLYDAALGAELERGDTVLALGGGVVGDIAGFLAATYMRGVAFVQVPTTLLAQVDSSVGGKVGVNYPQGKNLIGAFYQPRFVLADVRTLATLPLREVRAGLAEVIKYGVIYDAAFFTWLETHLEALLQLADAAVEQAVATSCAIKAAVVSADETEKGLRAILNFGHTLGHALEAATRYERFVHGEAVAIGMVFAARLAKRLGYFEPAGVERIAALVRRTGLPDTIPPDIAPEALLDAMRRDKKVAAGQLTFILPEAIGRVRIARGVPTDVVRSVLVEG
ncbi:3-dehydroquinate synthase [Thermodesulfitimonas sp.]